MTRYALTLAYDGSRFDGWQTQPSGNTVQDKLELALAAIAGHPVATICAGRTDAGVHANGQVVHFDSPAIRPDNAWVRGVNSHLPGQVAVLHAQVVRDDFHARYSAVQRRYVYFVVSSPVHHPLLKGRTGWVHRELDVTRMRDAAQTLAGTHDFSAFRSSQCQANSPVRTLNSIEVSSSGRMVRLAFNANAFLHHMIRNIVGTLIYIGDGRRPVTWARELLNACDRKLAAPTFAPDGLYFDSVVYPKDDAIVTRPAGFEPGLLSGQAVG
ncbi:MAG: tRNA pseudouridine(38-40) synthase TruA [Burkholderiaceae bacterium]